MTTTERLLRDAQATLQKTANGLARESLLYQAVGAWLTQTPPPEDVLKLLQLHPSPRNYEWIAVAALAEAVGWPSDGAALEDGLSWLSAVSLDRVGVPAPVTTDAIAQAVLALAVKRRAHLEPWFRRVVGHAPRQQHPAWASNGALAVLGHDVTSDGDAALRLALEAVDAATSRPGDDKEVINGLILEQLPDEALRAVVLICAVNWLRRTVPKMLPQQQALDGVMSMLKGVQADFASGTNAQGGRIRGAQPVPPYEWVGGPLRMASTQMGSSELIRRKILFLAANPLTTKRLAIDEELRDIDQKLQGAKHREAFELITRPAARPDDLEEALLREQPTIVHFSGHGSGISGIILHGEIEGEQKLVDANALKDLFSILRDNIRIVVLNACFSEEQARAIVHVVDFVVGMKDSIGDQAARLFSASFYRALGFGRSVQTAFDLGVNSLRRERQSVDVDIPVLLVKEGADPDKVVLIENDPPL